MASYYECATGVMLPTEVREALLEDLRQLHPDEVARLRPEEIDQAVVTHAGLLAIERLAERVLVTAS